MTPLQRRRQRRDLQRYPRPPQIDDPENADRQQLARHEMRAFDQLPPAARAAVGNCKFGVFVADTIREINRRGVSNEVKRSLKDKGLTPSDVGAGGVLIEEITFIERDESRRLAAEIEGRGPARRTDSAVSFVPRSIGLWR